MAHKLLHATTVCNIVYRIYMQGLKTYNAYFKNNMLQQNTNKDNKIVSKRE